ncbi:MAG: hypothetical protein HYT16_02405 [DPANN group archaeon]|nr:hypothetical protein [DPANN group archaeon]
MAGKLITIKIDRELYERVKKILGKNELKYKYSSVAAFTNEALFEKLESLKGKIKFPKIKW